MNKTMDTDALWTPVCQTSDILPNTGVCARVQGHHVAVFRVDQAGAETEYLAIDNVDPKSGASVLSRGLVGSLASPQGIRTVVASPLYKQHFDLRTGECLEVPEQSVRAHRVRLDGEQLLVALR